MDDTSKKLIDDLCNEMIRQTDTLHPNSKLRSSAASNLASNISKLLAAKVNVFNSKVSPLSNGEHLVYINAKIPNGEIFDDVLAAQVLVGPAQMSECPVHVGTVSHDHRVPVQYEQLEPFTYDPVSKAFVGDEAKLVAKLVAAVHRWRNGRKR